MRIVQHGVYDGVVCLSRNFLHANALYNTGSMLAFSLRLNASELTLPVAHAAS